jgi:hypothetical protein
MESHVILGGLVVSVPAIGPKVNRFKPGQGQQTFMGYIFRGTSSFGGEVKPSATRCKILQHVKKYFEV